MKQNPIPEGEPDTSASSSHDLAVQAEARRRSRRAFIGLGLGSLLGIGGWSWLLSRPEEDGLPAPLRRVLDANGQLSSAYFKQTRLAPEFARSRARTPRVNGRYGLEDPLDAETWRLRVQPLGAGPAQELTLADIQALPRVEMTTELKCIEGWSLIVHWAGARFSDFLARYPLAGLPGRPDELAPFVALRTPNGKYYVGLDMASALHPQTLLCYEMNGQPLTASHGAPLRLVTPLKYGIKHLKRIGTIAFATQRPSDFWAERGYDWDSGH
ncbi:molybdopterin-dependent oxidoreductase [Hymenobacter saemangeumensis]|uniref:Molybdopterin-dependent oxidoreductase n=1 Tax=Hymenobacter saemangeumensis TaxID=1084522 RepID=A0ABP8I1S4_9BACT